MNCGKLIVSRVARVCKRDNGGPHRFRSRWTSFLKSRLNCSIPGYDPFYFNEIQSISSLVEGRYGNTNSKLIYGVFTTPTNSNPGSAICAFSLQDITETFQGNFKEKNITKSSWSTVNSVNVPNPGPGSCHNDSRSLPDTTLNFIKTHSLMDGNVLPYFGQPLLIRASTSYRFTSIVVDSQIRTPGGKSYDVLFIGTEHGKIIKTINAESSDSNKKVAAIVIEELDVLDQNAPIRNLQIIRTQHYDHPVDGHYNDGKLVIVTDTDVVAIKLHRCDSKKITNCGECVALQDPYCAWDKIAGKCESYGSPRWMDFCQNAVAGQHETCSTEKIQPLKAVEQNGSHMDIRLIDREPRYQETIRKILSTVSKTMKKTKTIVETN